MNQYIVIDKTYIVECRTIDKSSIDIVIPDKSIIIQAKDFYNIDGEIMKKRRCKYVVHNPSKILECEDIEDVVLWAKLQ